MRKRDQKKEKAIMNEAYALKFKHRTDEAKVEAEKDRKRNGGLYGQWCRVKGHHPRCNCEYVRI